MEKRKVSLKMILAPAVIFALMAAFITYQVGIVYNTQPLPLDLAVQKAFIAMRSGALTSIVTVITHLSDPVTIVALCAALLIFPTRRQYGFAVTLAAATGLAIYKPMKHIFLRERPDIAYHLVEQGGYSFPSGHSVTSVIVYGLLFYLIGKYCKNPKLKVFLRVVCGFLAVVIGPSRLYVGVHWATDVLAGWCVGTAVLLTAIYILGRINKRSESI